MRPHTEDTTSNTDLVNNTTTHPGVHDCGSLPLLMTQDIGALRLVHHDNPTNGLAKSERIPALTQLHGMTGSL